MTKRYCDACGQRAEGNATVRVGNWGDKDLCDSCSLRLVRVLDRHSWDEPAALTDSVSQPEKLRTNKKEQS